MFALTRKTDYAIIALSHLAQHPQGLCTAREIADRYHVPQSLLMNVLKSLCHNQLVTSTRGVKGGYTLAMPADEITLAEIISAVDGPVRFVQCADQSAAQEPCDLLEVCPVTRPVRKVHEKLVEFLHQVTLAHIAYDPEYRGRGVALSFEGAALKTEPVST